MSIAIVGLGPAGIEHVNTSALSLIEAADTVVLRTLEHPAAAEVATSRDVLTCDDLYDSLGEFDEVYTAIADRVLDAAEHAAVVYAVPGSAVVGERSVREIRSRAVEAGIAVTIEPGQSFLDLAYIALALDPIADGLQVLDARDLPDPLPL
ncbi:MAG: SAM-dependent methyltransferase, partial [Actinomycetia bacterium]|nr:SAM-dependent methyltransferase [Actinomycetes bacterium]